MKTLLIGFLSVCFAQAYAQSKVEHTIDSLIANADYTAALKLIRIQNTSPLLINKEAEVLMDLGKLDEAEKALSTIAVADNQFVNAITESNQGFLYLLKGRSDRALEKLQQASNDFKISGHE